jgi:hypothetical protein
MRASLLTRAGSVAAAAVIATTGAMAVAGAADASVHYRHRIPTHLSDSKTVSSTDAKISGRLRTAFRHVRNIPLGGRLVFLETVTKMNGKVMLTKVAHEKTRIKKGMVGDYSFTVDPTSTTHYVVVFEGTPRLHSSHTRVVTVKG